MGIELGLLSAGLGIAGSVMGLAGASKSAEGAKEKGRAAQQVAEYNAAVDRQRAAEEIDQAHASEQDYLRKGSDAEASAVAMQGATGVTSQGSPLLVDENTVRQIALGAERLRAGGELRASRLEDDARLKQMEGANALKASYIDSDASLLTGVSSALGGVSKFVNPSFGKYSG